MTVCLTATIIEANHPNYSIRDIQTSETFSAVIDTELEKGTQGFFVGTYQTNCLYVSKKDVRQFLEPYYEEDVIFTGSELFFTHINLLQELNLTN